MLRVRSATLIYSVCPMLSLFIHEVSHDGITDEDAFGSQSQMLAIGQYKLASLDIRSCAVQAILVVFVSKVCGECLQIDALCGAQFGDDAFIITLLRCESLYFVRHIAALCSRDIFGDV